MFKFGFIWARGSGLRRLKPFLKEGFKNPKNFQKRLINISFWKFLKRVQRGTSFKKFLFGVLLASYKLQFDNYAIA